MTIEPAFHAWLRTPFASSFAGNRYRSRTTLTQENAMTRRNAAAVLTLTSLASAQPKQSSVRDRFIGVWKLVSCESKDNKTGKVQYPYGTKPVGRITYDKAGRMSAQVMDPERQAVGGSGARGLAVAAKEASCEQLRAMVAGYIAYFGKFEIDEAAHTVTHRIEASLIPSWVGTGLPRTYAFEGRDRLSLTVSTENDSTRLVWQRDVA
jgi:hypothetical protein